MDNAGSTRGLEVLECNVGTPPFWSVLPTGLKLSHGSKSQAAIRFLQRPKNIFIVRKWHSDFTQGVLVDLGKWLSSIAITVIVEAEDADGEFQCFDKFMSHIDLCICLGGDGTLLHLGSLFQDKMCPPVIAFAMGTLGFLTQMDTSNIHSRLEPLLVPNSDPVFITPRMRLMCEVYRKDCSIPEFRYQVLNECVIDRGSQTCLAVLELMVDDVTVTVVQADGLIVSTPTGSTAYSMSAGGSMVAPNVPAILITPICPHTLSFRPAVVPDCSRITIRLPPGKCTTASASFDGLKRTELQIGDEVRIAMSPMSIPTINEHGFNFDWFHSVVQKLHWNVRSDLRTPAPSPSL